MKIKNIKKILLSTIIVLLVSVIGVSSFNMAFADEDDEAAAVKNYISVAPNEFGGSHYSFTVDNGIDDETLKIGTQIETTDYVYTYGYKWGNTGSTPSYGNISNWTKVEDNNLGWGVAVKNKNKDSYENVYDMISGVPVTYMNNLFAGCTNLVTAPIISAYATDTTGMFSGCTKLVYVDLPQTLTTLGAGAFKGCTALRHILIPDSVIYLSGDSAANSVFYNCHKDLTIYCEFGWLERDTTSKWNYVSSDAAANTRYPGPNAEIVYETAIHG